MTRADPYTLQIFTHRSKSLLQSPPTAVNSNIKENITPDEAFIPAYNTEIHPTEESSAFLWDLVDNSPELHLWCKEPFSYLISNSPFNCTNLMVSNFSSTHNTSKKTLWNVSLLSGHCHFTVSNF